MIHVTIKSQAGKNKRFKYDWSSGEYLECGEAGYLLIFGSFNNETSNLNPEVSEP
jgi:hypothetical protein